MSLLITIKQWFEQRAVTVCSFEESFYEIFWVFALPACYNQLEAPFICFVVLM